jgi:lipooligosaccharide transport system ATP-binding protein
VREASPLVVDRLVKAYGGKPAVAGVSFALERGECFGLLGPNGAGKTTTLRCCLGLSAPDSGKITLLGEPVPARARVARAWVGVVPQFDNLDPDFTVAENLLVYGRYFGLTDHAMRGRIPDLLEFAGLGGKADVDLRTLSGGMKRRLVLARALVNDPDLLVLDEPTTGLDPQARHLMDEAERLCDRLAIVDGGRLIALGEPRSLIAECIEAQVVEVYGEGASTWAADESGRFTRRCEVSGETAFCYVADAAPLLAHLASRAQLKTLHRPANLEDVFLKLTGRELRD